VPADRRCARAVSLTTILRHRDVEASRTDHKVQARAFPSAKLRQVNSRQTPVVESALHRRCQLGNLARNGA
jgi:hypothetical protein